jgi:hypothetical protein
LLLHLQPLTPAHRADLVVRSLAKLIRKRLKGHSVSIEAAAHAVNRHAGKITASKV